MDTLRLLPRMILLHLEYRKGITAAVISFFYCCYECATRLASSILRLIHPVDKWRTGVSVCHFPTRPFLLRHCHYHTSTATTILHLIHRFDKCRAGVSVWCMPLPPKTIFTTSTITTALVLLLLYYAWSIDLAGDALVSVYVISSQDHWPKLMYQARYPQLSADSIVAVL